MFLVKNSIKTKKNKLKKILRINKNNKNKIRKIRLNSLEFKIKENRYRNNTLKIRIKIDLINKVLLNLMEMIKKMI
jgi:hypothetical protein